MEKRVQKRSLITILLVVLFACIASLAVLFAAPLAGRSIDGAEAATETETNNLRRAEDGTLALSALQGWTFGKWEAGDPESVKAVALRPEHGTTVYYSYFKDGAEDPVGRLAIVYSNETSTASMSFYKVEEVSGEYALGALISTEQDYLYTYNYELKAGNYRLEVTVPQVNLPAGSHWHWYENDTLVTGNGNVYPKCVFNYTFTIAPYKLNASSYISDPNLHIEFPEQNYVPYTGKANNTVSPTIKLYEKALEKDVDYELLSTKVDAGVAELTVKGINSLSGTFTIEGAFTIVKAGNDWNDVPTISHWAYNTFDRAINLISAEPEFGKDGLWFAITSDEDGKELIDGLDHITLDENGQVSQEVADILKPLHAGVYYLWGFVNATKNYEGLAPNPVEFRVFVATNSWEVAPSVSSWTEGEYELEENRIVASAVYGKTHILIVDEEGTVYYDPDNDINILSEAAPGLYTLTAYVDAADDYYGLDVYTVVFEVFKKPALPWWATMTIVVGAVAAAALVIFILWKQGVFQSLTEKIVVTARTHATIDATLAYIRASKAMDEGRQSVEEAKRRDALEEMRKKQEGEQTDAGAEDDDTTFVFAEGAPQSDAPVKANEETPAVEKPETPTEEYSAVIKEKN